MSDIIEEESGALEPDETSADESVEADEDEADTAEADTAEAETVVSSARPAESSDAAVQQLLAERQTAESNQDSEAVARVDARLGELGY